LAVTLLAGCVTLATALPEPEGQWAEFPIERKRTALIFGETFTLGDYELVYRGNTGSKEESLMSESSLNTRNYEFRRRGVFLNRVALKEFKRSVTGVGGFIITYETQKTIRLSLDGRSSAEYAVSEAPGEAYIIFRDQELGDVAFTFYKSRNRNDPETPYTYTTGFTVTAAAGDYGLLAFYPPALWVKRPPEAPLPPPPRPGQDSPLHPGGLRELLLPGPVGACRG